MFSNSKPYYLGEAKKRKRIFLQSQIHPNETHGTIILYSLVEKLKEFKIDGEVVVWPCINDFGFYSYCLNKNGLYNSDNGQNWNRFSFEYIDIITEFFQKKSELINSFKDLDTTIESLTVDIFNQGYGINQNLNNLLKSLKIALKSDYFIDIHTPEFGVQHLYCNQITPFVDSFSIEPTIIDNTDTQTYRNFLKKLFNKIAGLNNKFCQEYFSNREIVTLELPSNTVPTDNYVDLWTEKLINIIGFCGFIEQKDQNNKQFSEHKSYDISALKYYYSKSDGIIIQVAPLGTIIEKGNIIMKILSVDGKEHAIKANKKSVFLCFRDKKVTLKGEWVSRMLEIE